MNFSDSTDLKKGLSTFLNPYSFYMLNDKKELLSKFDRIYCDGIIFVILVRLIGIKVNRVSFDMTSLAPIVFDEAEKKGLSLAFIGGEEGIVEKAIDNFKQRYPYLNVCFSHSGFFCDTEKRTEVLKNIVKVNPDIVIVGMGAVLQELFLVDLAKEGWSGCGYTCGGFLHQSESKVGDYYPKYINRLNLRWAYRIFKEPKLAKRYFIVYPKSVFLFIKKAFFNKT